MVGGELLRKENESFLEYAERLIKGRQEGIYDLDKSEVYKLLYGTEVSSDHARKTLRVLEMTIEEAKKDQTNRQIHEELNDRDFKNDYKTKIEINKDGTQTSDKLIVMSEEECKDVEFLLKAHGYDIKVWELVSARNNIWNVYSKKDGIQTLYSSKIVVKPKIQEFDIEWVKEVFNELKDNYKLPIIKNKFVNQVTDKMLEINLADVHLNKLCFVDETGTEYNHTIAEEKLINIIHDIVERTKQYKFEKILLPVGQDFLNFDTVLGTTTKGTRQDASLRYPQMFKLSLKIFIYIINYLSQYAPVEVFYVGGNHDKMLSFCLVMALEQRYCNNENVYVDTSERLRKYYHYGNCLIGFAHGDEEKSKIGKLMAVEVPELWGKTKYREMHCSHLHKEMVVDEMNGLILRRISSISGTDAWSYENGYVGAIRKAQAFIWDKNYGLTDILNSVIV